MTFSAATLDPKSQLIKRHPDGAHLAELAAVSIGGVKANAMKVEG